MGGKERLGIYINGNDDITDSVLSVSEGGRKIDRGLRDWLQEQYNGAFDVELVHEPSGRSDLLLQQLEMESLPRDLAEQGFDDHLIATQFRSRLWQSQGEIDVVVFSIQPEVAHNLWRHREQGYLFYPPPRWEEEWTPFQKGWLQEQFSPLGLLGVEQFKEIFGRLIREVKGRLGSHIIAYGASSFDPDHHTHNYHGLEDPPALRIDKFNLALMQLSASEGVSIIDVDRIIALLGGARHVNKLFDYSGVACEAVGQEFLRVLADIGFFENRPLVMQGGQRRN
jgi:hypothetical protein